MRRVLVLVGALFLVMLGLAPVAGAATPPSSALCGPDDNYVKVCFVQSSDNIWVKDTEKDGRSAVAVYSTTGGASGQCRNADGYGTWVMCNHDFAECLSGGHNNYLTWYDYTYDAQTRDYNRISGPYRVSISPNSCPVPV